jgi:hypothetical protein
VRSQNSSSRLRRAKRTTFGHLRTLRPHDRASLCDPSDARPEPCRSRRRARAHANLPSAAARRSAHSFTVR